MTVFAKFNTMIDSWSQALIYYISVDIYTKHFQLCLLLKRKAKSPLRESSILITLT